ncbi:hypothetical protein CAEBREN_22926 [Caenorhabditis brenneri]|uniref:DNA-directed DNA polymerase n=1 Tax=Caenorhabditis brenneri TaxID=135651 RepID=G0NCD7_CAEBE|nr:hypothetical protein CAEBREN_22926 [Caenorhabditis brenneri]
MSGSSAQNSFESNAIANNWPTDNELEFFDKFADIVDAPELIRTSSHTLKLPPCRIQLKNLENLPKDKPLDEHVGNLFDIFIRKTIKNADGDLTKTKYWLNLQHPDYVEGDGFWIMHKTYQMANGHTLMNLISKYNQSKTELSLDETLKLSMRIFKTVGDQMSGRGNRIPDQILKKFGLNRQIVLGDSHCLPKAIVIGKCWSDMHSAENPAAKRVFGAKFRSFTRQELAKVHRPRFQLEEAKKLLSECGMNPNTGEHTNEDLKQIADHLKDYHICVWSMLPGVAVPTVTFEVNKGARGFIPLFYIDEHYEFFTPKCEKVNSRFCFKCHKLAGQRHWKTCSATCNRCGRLNCEPTNEEKYCDKCNIVFLSVECYDAHLKKNKPVSLPFCQKYEKCVSCFVIHRRFTYSGDLHVCFHKQFCNICKQKVKGVHDCVHAPVTEAAKARNLRRQESWVVLIYDIETIVSSTADYRGASSLGQKHEPNVICFRMICNKCMGKYCIECGEARVLTYNLRNGESGTVLERFVNFLKTGARMKNAYIIAHNGGNYDHVYVLEELMRNETYTPNFVMNGSSFISATVQIAKDNTLHFLDSLKFLPMRLAQLPGAFELSTESKGHFPYMFNHPGNYGSQLATLPPIEYYEPQYMGVKQRKEFEEWYAANKDTRFNFDEEIVRYCKNDVDILTEALVKFIEVNLQICQESFAGWNPIIQSTTIASYIMFVLKNEHMKEPTIGFIPETGWSGRNNSTFALKFLLWTEQTTGVTLRHKLRVGGEKVLKLNNQTCYVDGYNEETREVYEIHGCMFHGCPRCYLDRERPSPHDKNKKVRELYDATMAKDNGIRASGYTLHVHWECDLREEMRTNEEMKQFFKNCNYAHQLLPREAMYGGRTQQFKSFVAADDEYTIEYFDYCSLYPYVNIRGTMYPIGLPRRITGPFEKIILGQPLPYKGLVFCDVLPPTNCPIPVLPVRAHGKLIFPLCRTCAFSKTIVECTHRKASLRYLTGVWCTDELNLAISEGYQMLRYHEVWNWPDDKWFRGGFFKSFMEPLLKTKHESSGWPSEEMSEEEKKAHVETIAEMDGVQMDPARVKKNPALRSLAKLFLNSTWGKFAQNPCKTETKLLPTTNGLGILEFFEEQGFNPKCFKEWGENHALVARRPLKEALKTAHYTNIVYGALTTSGARIKLFEAMKRVGAENLIYCDTDSLIFRQKRGVDLLGDLKGEALGKMTREVPMGWWISEAVAMAAKVYALKMTNDLGQVKYVTKAKGITLNSETSDLVNFETMKELMLKKLRNGECESFTVNRIRMKRGSDILDGLRSVVEPKRLKPVMDKGLFDSEGDIIPFGTIDIDQIENDYPFFS